MSDRNVIPIDRARKRRRPTCERCGRQTANLERFGDDGWLCRNQYDCEKHWPDMWPEGTRGVPADRIEGHASADLTLTACDELELRRRAADGSQDAVAEMARRNRMRVGRAQMNPKDHWAPDRREPGTGFVSTGRRVTRGGGGDFSAGRHIA